MEYICVFITPRVVPLPAWLTFGFDDSNQQLLNPFVMKAIQMCIPLFRFNILSTATKGHNNILLLSLGKRVRSQIESEIPQLYRC